MDHLRNILELGVSQGKLLDAPLEVGGVKRDGIKARGMGYRFILLGIIVSLS